MKKVIPLGLLLLFTFNTLAQNKEQLIAAIIKNNVMESDCVGNGCRPGENYVRFQTLANQLSTSELEKLTTHKNAVLRMYAIQYLIQKGKANVPALFDAELSRNEYVETFVGCLMDQDPTSSVVYLEYEHKIWLEAGKSLAENEQNDQARDLAEQRLLQTDKVMQQLDSIVVTTRKEVWWLLYDRAFSQRKFNETLLPNIEQLAFVKNNSYALEYLSKQYPDKYNDAINEYFTTVFPKADFDGDGHENIRIYFENYIEYLLASGNVGFRQVAINKLKNDKASKGEWWLKTLMKDYNIDAKSIEN